MDHNDQHGYKALSQAQREQLLLEIGQARHDVKAHYERKKDYSGLLPGLETLIERYHESDMHDAAERLQPWVRELASITTGTAMAKPSLQRAVHRQLTDDLRDCGQWHAEAEGLPAAQARLVAETLLGNSRSR